MPNIHDLLPNKRQLSPEFTAKPKGNSTTIYCLIERQLYYDLLPNNFFLIYCQIFFFLKPDLQPNNKKYYFVIVCEYPYTNFSSNTLRIVFFNNTTTASIGSFILVNIIKYSWNKKYRCFSLPRLFILGSRLFFFLHQ